MQRPPSRHGRHSRVLPSQSPRSDPWFLNPFLMTDNAMDVEIAEDDDHESDSNDGSGVVGPAQESDDEASMDLRRLRAFFSRESRLALELHVQTDQHTSSLTPSDEIVTPFLSRSLERPRSTDLHRRRMLRRRASVGLSDEEAARHTSESDSDSSSSSSSDSDHDDDDNSHSLNEMDPTSHFLDGRIRPLASSAAVSDAATFFLAASDYGRTSNHNTDTNHSIAILENSDNNLGANHNGDVEEDDKNNPEDAFHTPQTDTITDTHSARLQRFRRYQLRERQRDWNEMQSQGASPRDMAETEGEEMILEGLMQRERNWPTYTVRFGILTSQILKTLEQTHVLERRPHFLLSLVERFLDAVQKYDQSGDEASRRFLDKLVLSLPSLPVLTEYITRYSTHLKEFYMVYLVLIIYDKYYSTFDTPLYATHRDQVLPLLLTFYRSQSEAVVDIIHEVTQCLLNMTDKREAGEKYLVNFTRHTDYIAHYKQKHREAVNRTCGLRLDHFIL